MNSNQCSTPDQAAAAGQTTEPSVTLQLNLEPANAKRLANLTGQFDQHLQQIEQRLGIEIRNRSHLFSLSGRADRVNAGAYLLKDLYTKTRQGKLDANEIHLAIQEVMNKSEYNSTPARKTVSQANNSPASELTLIRTKKCTVKPRGDNQQNYVAAVQSYDINFGVGPAGTGKTYLAVACAVEALLKDEIERILLVRPAVEAGEKLGFLPGDLSQKVDPYLRPLFDALYEMLGTEAVDKLIERNVIEIAPLAYMRGRTLNNSFIILDESQNTTREQMKMFLTRIGFGSTAVINGDPSQIDLPRGVPSGLRHAIEVLDGVEGISFTFFLSKDIVRHPLVQRIVDAYEAFQPSPKES